ncbi:MAG TPA: MFS transporter [Streptosporangiaceae bacterium]|jgi:MFS family permease
MSRSQAALLVALGIDNVGSGLFLPLAVVYATRVVHLPLGTAGALISAGTVAGLAVPPAAGRLVDRIGPRLVVIAAQLLQAAGAATYLLAHSAGAVLAAAILLGAGQQMFYSSLFALIADVAPAGPRDRPFAVAAMVRSACFGLGGLIIGALLAGGGTVGYRIAVAADTASFLACAVLLAACVRIGAQRRPAAAAARSRSARLLTDWPFLALIVANGLSALPSDIFLVGMPVYVLVRLHGPAWLPGTILALLTALTSAGATLALRLAGNRSRVAVLQAGAALLVLWSGAALAAVIVPASWRPAELLAITVVLASASLLSGRASALAEAAAPQAQRGPYLAAFQYAYGVAGVLAPGVVALFSVALWLPWLIAAASAGLAIIALRALAGHLPPSAVWPQPAGPGAAPVPAAARQAGPAAVTQRESPS